MKCSCLFQNVFLLCYIYSFISFFEAGTTRRCTGFFCMDDDFFNHLGPFFQTTPRITIQEKEDATEQPFLPKVVNSPEVTWSPPLVDDDAIYEGDYSYYFDNELDDYEWKPYQPTDQMVNKEVDVLTAPFNESTDARDIEEAQDGQLPFLESLSYYDDDSKNDYDYVEAHDSCPKNHCRCVCDSVPLS